MKGRIKHGIHGLFALVLAWSTFFLLAPQASALYGDSDGDFGLDGSLRTVGGVADNYDCSQFFGPDNETDEFAQGILRITAMGTPTQFFEYEVHLVQSITWSSAASKTSGPVGSLTAGQTRYRFLDDGALWWEEEDANALLWADRANFHIATRNMDFTVGRQAITFGKAYFWNPLDVYLPFDPNQFDRDYKPGVDAVRLDFPFGIFSGCTLVAAWGRQLTVDNDYESSETTAFSWYGSSLLARFFSHVSGWDVAVQGGKIYGGNQLGWGVVGEMGEIQLRHEAAYFWAEDNRTLPYPFSGSVYENGFTAVLGAGHRFVNSLDLEAEYLFNGRGNTSDLSTAWVRFSQGALIHLQRHLFGVTASYEFSPLVTGRLAGIYGISDGSMQVQPTVTISLSDNADCMLGGVLNMGDRPGCPSGFLVLPESEFGTYPNYAFAELKVYF